MKQLLTSFDKRGNTRLGSGKVKGDGRLDRTVAAAAAAPSRPVRSLQSSCARESERDGQLADVRKSASRWKRHKPVGLPRLQLERCAGMRGAGQG